MASTAYRRGYGWDLPTGSSGRASISERNNIRIFSAKGISAPGVLGTAPLPQIGTPIPGTNLVYVRPRLSQDEGLLGGGGGSQFPYRPYRWPGAPEEDGLSRTSTRGIADRSVHITNPQYAFYRRFQRTASIGMGGALSMGRNMDVPFGGQNAPYFSIP